MIKVTINELLCKGCGLCARACPKNVLALSRTKSGSRKSKEGKQKCH